MNLFVIVLLLSLSLTPSPSSSSSDFELLISFKNSLPNPNILLDWDPHSSSPCSFSGVTCISSSVVSVNLSGLQLSTSSSSLLPLLSLPSLHSLSLSSCNLTGLLPSSSLAPKLDLSFNSIDADLTSLLSSPTITNLNLTSNIISGRLPPVSNCSSLLSLDLSSNNISGPIPPSAFSSCSNLAFLNLSSNRLTGTLPHNLASPSSLHTLSLSNNFLSGNIPLPSLSTLKTLHLSFNNFTGALTATADDASNLEVLDLSSNRLSGSVPSSLCNNINSSMKELYLQDNQFTGAIPPSLANCSKLLSLDLSFNYLTGPIPPSLGSLSGLNDLILWQNALTGDIPGELGLNLGLQNLILDDNGLTGSIPQGLSNCTSLNWISLSSNRLSGAIPSWLGSLRNLAILKLGNNSFTGEIPGELGDCRSLVWLDLNSNYLGGRIPGSLAKQSGKIAVGLVTGKRFVYLKSDGSKECHGAGNLLEFAGIRQEELARLPSRGSCNFTRIYHGNTEYTFNNNGSMIFLDLSYNQLQGEIPDEIGTMYYLAVLNLGHNSLSGLISPVLGNLRNVGVMDLSHNQLQGPIPASFSGLSLLTEIDLSNNQLNGTIPELGQLATLPSYRYENNSGLCGFPLPPCVKGSIAGLTNNRQISRRRQASIVASIAMVLLVVVLCTFAAIIFILESKRKRNSNRSSNNHREIYIDSRSRSRSHSGTANSLWKLAGTKEAMSISLATFEKPLQKLTLADLLEATNGFHNDSLVGSGGFGDVYRARLKDGSVVAIKKLIHISGQGDREFMAEMETIGRIKHRNLVPLLGYCKVGEERLLVYEYMKYGSLEDVLHDRKKLGIKLNWAARRKIAVGAARGLAFLHHSCTPHIIHRDMKSSNVLVDENLEARVSDFGMARMMSTMDTHLSVSTLAGTPGYVPPEYYQSFRCTTKGDVYSYGVVLLELLTGRQPTDSSDFGDNNLVGWVKQYSKIKIRDVFDPVLLKEDPSLELELLQHLKIACACLDDRPLRRPAMLTVMAMFKEIQAGSVVSSIESDVTVSLVDDGSFNAVDMREGG